MKVTAESSRGRELKRLYTKYSDLPNDIIREITELRFRAPRKTPKKLYVDELVRINNRMKILYEKIVNEFSYFNYKEYEMLQKSKEKIIQSYLKDRYEYYEFKE